MSSRGVVGVTYTGMDKGAEAAAALAAAEGNGATAAVATAAAAAAAAGAAAAVGMADGASRAGRSCVSCRCMLVRAGT